MNDFYHVSFEAFPHQETIYSLIEPLFGEESNSDLGDFFSIEVPREVAHLSKLIRKCNAHQDLDTSIANPTSFARNVLHKNVGHCYIPKDNIESIHSLYKNSPKPLIKEFPGKEDDALDANSVLITESFVLKDYTEINNKIYNEGTRINLSFKGKLDE